MHPIGGGAYLPMVTALARAGRHVVYCGSRYRGNDTALIMEKARSTSAPASATRARSWATRRSCSAAGAAADRSRCSTRPRPRSDGGRDAGRRSSRSHRRETIRGRRAAAARRPRQPRHHARRVDGPFRRRRERSRPRDPSSTSTHRPTPNHRPTAPSTCGASATRRSRATAASRRGCASRSIACAPPAERRASARSSCSAPWPTRAGSIPRSSPTVASRGTATSATRGRQRRPGRPRALHDAAELALAVELRRVARRRRRLRGARLGAGARHPERRRQHLHARLRDMLVRRVWLSEDKSRVHWIYGATHYYIGRDQIPHLRTAVAAWASGWPLATSLRRRYGRPMRLEGIHHVTCVTADAPATPTSTSACSACGSSRRRSTRPTRRPTTSSTATRSASYGNNISFFEYRGRPDGRAGAGNVHRIVWRVGSEAALDFWERRLADEGLAAERAETTLRFCDPRGARARARGRRRPRPAADRRGAGHSRRVRAAGLRRLPRRTRGTATRAERSCIDRSGLPPRPTCGPLRGPRRAARRLVPDRRLRPRGGEFGAGVVQHVAWGCHPEDIDAWQRRLVATRAPTRPSTVDRHFFRSVYFTEPGGVLFEIAELGGPGFIVDEPTPSTWATASAAAVARGAPPAVRVVADAGPTTAELRAGSRSRAERQRAPTRK